jgi:hypothetical protein
MDEVAPKLGIYEALIDPKIQAIREVVFQTIWM